MSLEAPGAHGRSGRGRGRPAVGRGGSGVPVCEHMTNLAAVPATGGRLHAVPIAWVGGASFPVRAYVLC